VASASIWQVSEVDLAGTDRAGEEGVIVSRPNHRCTMRTLPESPINSSLQNGSQVEVD
jgi:hypothetical protein